MPCPNTAVSGDCGEVAIDGVRLFRLTQWSINPTASVSEWGDSEGGAYTNRKRARLDATGTIEGKLDEVNQWYDQFDAGDCVSLQLFEDNCEGAAASDVDVFWWFPSVIITDVSMTFDNDTKEVVGWSANWGTDGPFYKPGAAPEGSGQKNNLAGVTEPGA